MRWVEVAALLTVVVLTLLPSRVAARVGALARGGRLDTREPSPPGRRIDAASVLAAAATLSPRTVATTLAAVCLVVSALVTPVAGIDAAVVLGTTMLLVRDARSSRETSARLVELRSVVGLLEAELQAGSPPSAALAAAAASSPLLSAALTTPAVSGARCASDPPRRQAAVGWDAAALLVACPDRDLQRLGIAWRVAESTGVPLADVLGRLAVDLRARVDQRRAVDVALAGPKSSAALLCLLPALGVALGAAMGARPLAMLAGTPSGRLLGCVGLLLDAAGVLWVRRILLRAAR